MRFATYRHEGEDRDRVGLVRESAIHEMRGVTALLDLLGDDGERLHAAGEAALRDPGEVVEVGTVRLRSPIPRPPSVRDFMTFEQHIEGTTLNYGPEEKPPKVWYRQPLFYFSNPAALFGPGEGVPMPPGARMFDFESEVAAVIGRDGADLDVEEAADYIVGYTIMNDWSARDLQSREMTGNLGPAKGKDTATSLGPYLVTADELAPFAHGPSFALAMEVELNGQVFGSDRLDHMGWSFAQMVAYASRGTTVTAGDVLGSGTCGAGCIAEKWGREGHTFPALAVGDVVTLRVEQLGELTNEIVAGPPLREIGAMWSAQDGAGST
jgi:2-keto-4-pentenoate hydratase/2-oxohepta-3-ene-1,7-dioic acid hydratase in catechol pathway